MTYLYFFWIRFDNANWASKLIELGNNGTDNTKNLNDPFGDGDQSLIFNHVFAQFHRDLWSAGGDTQECFNNGSMPPFTKCVMLGMFPQFSFIL